MHIHGISFFILALLVRNTESSDILINFNPTKRILQATIRKFKELPENKCEWLKASCHPRDVNCLSLKTLEYVNDIRRKNSLPPYKTGTLKQLENSMKHNRDMVENNKLYHQKLRLVKLGCNSFFSGENVAVNHVWNCRIDKRDPAKICVDQFIASPGHFKNLINKDHERMVMGVPIADNGQIWCTQTFSRFTKLTNAKGCGEIPVGSPVPPSAEPSASASPSTSEIPSDPQQKQTSPAASIPPTPSSVQEPNLVPPEISQGDGAAPEKQSQHGKQGKKPNKMPGQEVPEDENPDDVDVERRSRYGGYRYNGWGMYASTGYNFHFKWFFGRVPNGRRSRLRLICIWRCQYCSGWRRCMTERRSVEMDRYLTSLHN